MDYADQTDSGDAQQPAGPQRKSDSGDVGDCVGADLVDGSGVVEVAARLAACANTVNIEYVLRQISDSYRTIRDFSNVRALSNLFCRETSVVTAYINF